MPFNIYDRDTKSLVQLYPVEPGEPEVYVTFETADEAKDYCARWPRCQPRPAVVSDSDWKAREAQRIASGVYKRPDYLNMLEDVPSHFLHLADKRPGQLAYTKDAEKGARDIQTIVSLQGYFEAYRPDADSHWRAQVEVWHEEATLGEDGLKFATTPDEITGVYRNYDSGCAQVANSCMRHSFSDCPQHPVSVYGAGDLAVAYLTNASGRTIARALCWPKKLVYSRVYSESDRLHRLLQKRGFVKSEAYFHDGVVGRNLRGARLLRIEHEDDDECFLVPYCDDVLSAHDNGKFLILGGGDLDLRNTTGWTREDPGRHGGYTCDRCGDEMFEDDGHCVYTSRFSTENWCEVCYDNYTFNCADTDNTYSDCVDSVSMANGETWSIYAFNAHGFSCQRTDENYSDDDGVEVVVDTHLGTETWGPDAVLNDTWTSDHSGLVISDDVEGVTVIVDGVEQRWLASEAESQDVTPEGVLPASGKLTLAGDDPGQLNFDEILGLAA